MSSQIFDDDIDSLKMGFANYNILIVDRNWLPIALATSWPQQVLKWKSWCKSCCYSRVRCSAKYSVY
jgi:hypothetical protein